MTSSKQLNAFNCVYICSFSKSQKEKEEKNIKAFRRITSVPTVQQRLLFDFLADLQVKSNSYNESSVLNILLEITLISK